jgi:hypothetical protein
MISRDLTEETKEKLKGLKETLNVDAIAILYIGRKPPNESYGLIRDENVTDIELLGFQRYLAHISEDLLLERESEEAYP